MKYKSLRASRNKEGLVRSREHIVLTVSEPSEQNHIFCRSDYHGGDK